MHFPVLNGVVSLRSCLALFCLCGQVAEAEQERLPLNKAESMFTFISILNIIRSGFLYSFIKFSIYPGRKEPHCAVHHHLSRICSRAQFAEQGDVKGLG